MMWLSDDITFCMEECENKDCFRNKINIRCHDIPHSFSMLKDSADCPSYYEEKEVENDIRRSNKEN